MILTELKNANLINPPDYVLDNLCLLSFGGSISYDVNTLDSDVDLIGFYVPPREYIYQTGIYNFDKMNLAEVYSVHHIQYNGKSYDITIYPIINIFKLALDGNSVILDFLMNDLKHVIYRTDIGDYVLQNREMFLSKKCVAKFMGFAQSELSSIEKGVKQYKDIAISKPQRLDLYLKYSYDTKHGGNLVRLYLSLKDLLTSCWYRPNSHYPYIRKVREGLFTLKEIKDFFNLAKESIAQLEKQSKLRDEPDREKIRKLLVDSIDKFYHRRIIMNFILQTICIGLTLNPQ